MELLNRREEVRRCKEQRYKGEEKSELRGVGGGVKPVGDSPPNSNMEEVEAVADACKHLADGAGDAAISTKANLQEKSQKKLIGTSGAYVAKLKENVLLL